ncbi:ComF family protein [Marinomonas balearica]|uniref:ComF family protein n=1 Tax=Marinomonas balearica TaxID=491947 RepID=A0A4R6M9Z7_9GAMM|nr:ComF family protein [Marinomonas balearica]TDO98273.1 ComF family protein [Marinomonas balearica]
MDWSHLSTKLFSVVYYRFFLKHCYLCRQPSSSTLCTWCQPLLDTKDDRCSGCGTKGEFLSLCGKCQSSKRPWQSCLVATDYESTNSHLIRAAKFHNQHHYFRIYSDILAQKICEHYGEHLPTHWATVPSHINRVRERGKCSNDIVYKTLKQSLYHTIELNKPINRLYLKKQIHTAPQHQQTRTRRLAIPSSLFQCPEQIQGHVALIDDVMTTGSTLEACTHSLLKAGASRVDVWVFARTPASL